MFHAAIHEPACSLLTRLSVLHRCFGKRVGLPRHERCSRICAQEIYFVRFGHLIAELFEPNSCVRLAFRLQESPGFTAHSNLTLLCF